MKKNLFLLTILFSFLATTYVSSQENVIIPLKKPTLNPELKEKKISINIIKPLEKPILVKEVKKKDEKEEIVENKKITKLGIIVPKNKPKIVQKTIEKVAKKSKYFSKKEFELAAKAINAMQKGNWPSALSLAKKTRNNDIYSFIQWRHLLTNRNNASYYDYQQFIDKNPDYPRIGRIKYLSEHKLSTEKVSPKKIIKKFSDEEPLSGFGEMILGESYIINGESAKGINLIKKGFEKAELSKSDLRFFRKKYKKYLNSEDYIKRAKYLAWENKYWDLKRMLRYLPKEEQLLYTARQLLMSKSYGVDNAIAKVPDRLKNDSGLNYDRLKWRRKRGRVDSSLEILLKVPNNKIYLVRPEKWWKEREIIGRSLIYKKKYELAYKVVSKHSMVEGPEYAAAEWMSGWIALSFLNDPILAVEHFDNFYNNVGYPISLARGAYWLGRSYEKMGSKDLQNKWYQEASKYLTTYYGQLAFLKINPEKTF